MLKRFSSSLTICAVVLSGLLVGCGGGDLKDGNADPSSSDANTSGNNGIVLTIPSQPTVLDAVEGKVKVAVNFIARDRSGTPIPEEFLDVAVFVDGDYDNEGSVNQFSQALKVNVCYAMVLDASYSMTQHNPPAFEPMKAAARASYQQLLDLWRERPGKVNFYLSWFEEQLNQSRFNVSQDRAWEPNDILSIPTPASETATKLYAAVDNMANHLRTEYENGVCAGPRDQFVMLVFSDGKDNYSWYYNEAGKVDLELTTSTGAPYRHFDYEARQLSEVLNTISAHPKLTVHVIGLGSQINAEELKKIADTGKGSFQSNPSSENIGQLFERVLQEFTVLQTREVKVPLQDGEHTFRIDVTRKDTQQKAQYGFRFMLENGKATVIEN